MPNIVEIHCKHACTEGPKDDLSSTWHLNLYRGCMHRCIYCFAIYTHDYLHEGGNYYDDIYVKVNIAHRLEKQLRSPNWTKESIGICGVTDCYQPLEAKYKLMPDILRVLIKYKNPCAIFTKSDLILRDYDLIDELSRVANVSINASISCIDDEIQKIIEPGAKTAAEKFQMLKEFSKTNARVGVLHMPIIPYITDERFNIEQLYVNAANSGVNYIMSGVLYLREPTRKLFFDAIKREFPHTYEPLKQLYSHGVNGEASTAYKSSLYKMIKEIKRRYRLVKKHRANDHATPLISEFAEKEAIKKITKGYQQLSLFDTNATHVYESSPIPFNKQHIAKPSQHTPRAAFELELASFAEIEMESSQKISTPAPAGLPLGRQIDTLPQKIEFKSL